MVGPNGPGSANPHPLTSASLHSCHLTPALNYHTSLQVSMSPLKRLFLPHQKIALGNYMYRN